MAEPLNPESASAQHNVGARRDRLNDSFDIVFNLEMQIAAAIEEHVKPLRDKKNKEMRELRADLDMHGADIKPLYDLYKRKRLVDTFEDDDDRNKSLDSLRETYQALSEGGQLDWIIASGEEEAVAAE